MADKLGEVYYEAHIRGDDLPPEARRLGKHAGTELGESAGKATDESFDDSLKKSGSRWANTMERNGKGMSRSLRKGMQNGLDKLSADMDKTFSSRIGLDVFIKKSGDADRAVKQLSINLQHLHEEGRLNNVEFKIFNQTLRDYVEVNGLSTASLNDLSEAESRNTTITQEQKDAWAAAASAAREKSSAETESTEATEKNTEATDKLANRMRKATKDTDGHSNSMRGHGRRLREWQAIALAITAAAPEIGVLGSAVGGALLIIGAAAASSAVGIGVFVAAFKGLGGPLKDLPASIRPAAEAFQAFKASLGGLQDAIQGAAAGGLTTGFQTLKTIVEALTPAFTAFGTVVGNIFANITAALAPGTAGFEKLNTFIAASAPVFEQVVNAAMGLGGILGSLFIDALPYVMDFVTGLSELLNGFSAWLDEAKNATFINTFFESTALIMGSIIDLAGALGTTLQNAISANTAAAFASFIGQLAAFLPTVGKLIGLVEQLGIFEILGAVFEALTPILDALMPALNALASSLSGVLISAVQALTPILVKLAETLSPIIMLVADQLLPALLPLLDIFIALLEPILKVAGVLLDALMPLLIPLIDLLVVLIDVALEPTIDVLNIFADAITIAGGIIKLFAQILGAVVATIVALFKGDLSSIGRIWSDLWKGMEGTVKQIWNSILDFVAGGVNGLIDILNNAIKQVKSGPFAGLFSGVGKIGKVSFPHLASGAMALKSTFALIGEAGPEAVVPLNRPLSQVDPAVRPLSAFAQGLDTGTGTGKSVVIAEGAIQIVTPTRDPVLLANMVMDNVVAHALS